jgi:hypothetical protein
LTRAPRLPKDAAAPQAALPLRPDESTDPAARHEPGEWLVTDGTAARGPFPLGHIVHDVAAGRLPADAFVRHLTWKVWKPIGEVAELPGGAAEAAEERAAPRDPIGDAPDLHAALVALLAVAVEATASEVGTVHEVREEHAVVVGAHGPRAAALADERPGLLDPSVIAAAAGAVVMVEPAPGPAGQAILARLAKLGDAPTAAFMIPIRPRGRLFGMLEIGRAAAYRAAEVARAEALVDALVAKVEAARWA